jgi:hypothetical protein
MPRDLFQKERTLTNLQKAVQKCRGCDLYRYATQAVFGELVIGLSATKPKVSIMMIGEQPGDSEDKEEIRIMDQRFTVFVELSEGRDVGSGPVSRVWDLASNGLPLDQSLQRDGAGRPRGSKQSPT